MSISKEVENTTGTQRPLESLGTRKAPRTWALKALGDLGTWTLRHSGTWALTALYLADSIDISKFSQIG